MKHEVMMLNDDDLLKDPLLGLLIPLLRDYAYLKGCDPEKPLTIRFKSQIFPITNKE